MSQWDNEIKPFYEDERLTIFNADSWRVVEQLPRRHFDIIFTDPPYGVSKEYGNVKDQGRPMLQFWAALAKLLKPDGSLHMTVSTKHLPEWMRRLSLSGWHYKHLSCYYNTTRKTGNVRGANFAWPYAWEPWLSYTLGEDI